MKTDRIILVLVVVIMLASVVGSYFLFLQQDALSGKKIEAVRIEVEKLAQSFKQVNSKVEEFSVKSMGSIDMIKQLEEKVNSVETDRADINAKVSDLMKSVEELKKNAGIASAPAAVAEEAASLTALEPQSENSTGNVDLGQIPVEK